MAHPSSPWEIHGRVRTGLGRGAGFTGLQWARTQFMSGLGIDPFPGTLNIEVADDASLATWKHVTGTPGQRMVPERAGDCGARCYPLLIGVGVRGKVTGAAVLPEVQGYAENQVEVIAAVPLRQLLELQDGHPITLMGVAPTPVRGVLFDVDGTLVNSIDGYRLAAERAVAPFGWTVSDEAVRRALNFGEQFWQLVLPAEHHADAELIDRLRRDTMRHWPDVLEQSVVVLPGVAHALHTLKDFGVRLGICTSSRGEAFLPLETAGLLGLFDEIVTARDVLRRKPEPEGLLLCMERLGLQTHETVYVGDSVVDIRASQAAGFYSVGVLTGAGDSSLLSEAGAHRLIPDLWQLPALIPNPRRPAL